MKKIVSKNTEKSRDNNNNQKLQQNCSYCGEFPTKPAYKVQLTQ